MPSTWRYSATTSKPSCSVKRSRRIAHGVFERSPEHGTDYRGFVDPSGGSADRFTAAVSHYDPATQTVFIDAIREVRPPFSPEQVCLEFSELFKRYGIRKVLHNGAKFAEGRIEELRRDDI